MSALPAYRVWSGLFQPAATKRFSGTWSVVMNPEQYMTAGVGAFPILRLEVWPFCGAAWAGAGWVCASPVAARARISIPSFFISPPLERRERNQYEGAVIRCGTYHC